MIYTWFKMLEYDSHLKCFMPGNPWVQTLVATYQKTSVVVSISTRVLP